MDRLDGVRWVVNQQPGGRRSGPISQASATPGWNAASVVPICLPLVCFIFGNTSLVLDLGWGSKKKKNEAARDASEEEEGMERVIEICVCAVVFV